MTTIDECTMIQLIDDSIYDGDLDNWRTYNNDEASDSLVDHVLAALSWYDGTTPAGLGAMRIDWTDLERPAVTVGVRGVVVDALDLTTDPHATGIEYPRAIGRALIALHDRIARA